MELPAPPNRKALFFIVVTIMLDTLGLTLLAPVAPFLVARYVTDPASLGAAVGWLASIYSICQFTAAPGLGALSDRFGRRPILLLCLLGSAVGYLLIGLGGALWVLFVGRAIDGLTGANTSVIIAYITDIVPADERGKYFGWIGAIGAVSVVLGPAAGGLLARFGYQVPFFVAACVSLINLVIGLFFLPESLPKAQRPSSLTPSALNPLGTLRDVLRQPQLRWLIIATFLYTLALIAIPSNISVFTHDRLNWDADSVGVLFSIFGAVTILVQALLLPWALKRFNPALVTLGGFCFTIASFLLIALVAPSGFAIYLYFGILVFGIGDGLTSPALLDLITRSTDAQSQGRVQGGSQSVQSLANMIGPVLAGELYDHLGHASPYLAGGGIVLLALVVLILALPSLRKVIAP